ncbi:hypothetical protein MTO96_030959 [Rhipicephalus appendiculatus]
MAQGGEEQDQEEQESSGHEPAPAPPQPNSTAALASGEPAAPAANIPNTEKPAFMVLVGIVAVLTVGVVAVAIAWYLLKETPGKDPKDPGKPPNKKPGKRKKPSKME